MLNLFPTIFLSLFAHALLRVALGSIFLLLGYRHLLLHRAALIHVIRVHWPRLGGVGAWTFGISELILGGMFILGAYTQAAALVAILVSLKMLILRRRLIHPSIPQPLFYVLVIAISLSLFITGAGALAFDLPL